MKFMFVAIHAEIQCLNNFASIQINRTSETTRSSIIDKTTSASNAQKCALHLYALHSAKDPDPKSIYRGRITAS